MEEVINKAKKFYQENQPVAIIITTIIALLLLCGGCTLSGLIANYLFFSNQKVNPADNVVIEDTQEETIKEYED